MKSTLFKPAPLEEIILGATVASTLVVIQFPFQRVNGSLVPTIIFKGRPFMFHYFILCLNFAFLGSVATISHRDKHPKLARCFVALAALSIAAAFAIIVRLTVPESFLPLTWMS